MNNKTQNMMPMLRPGQAPLGIGVLVSTCLFFLIIVGFLQIFLVSRFDNMSAVIRISAVLQDLLVFMLPALLTTMLITRLPASFLQIDRRPSLSFLSAALITLVIAMPCMNYIIDWNAGLTLPASMQGFEEWARDLENQAQASVKEMMGDGSFGSVAISIAIIGMLAPLCEELFFRGALQRLLIATRMNVHIAIWITAVLFSVFHMQFFGFVPRLLLGAFFGYMTYWSGSLWTSVCAHALNNTLAVIFMYMSADSGLDTIGADGTAAAYWAAGISVLLTFCGITWLSTHRPSARRNTAKSIH